MISASQKNRFRRGFRFAFLGAVTLSGCVSLKTHQRELNESYIRGLQRARRIAADSKCEGAQRLISSRIDLEQMKLR
jgi:hypothetical protein